MFNFKALVSALLFSATVFGVAVRSAEHLARGDQAKGIDVSSEQGDLDWRNLAADGISFAYIEATEGTSRSDAELVAQCIDTSFQAT